MGTLLQVFASIATSAGCQGSQEAAHGRQRVGQTTTDCSLDRRILELEGLQRPTNASTPFKIFKKILMGMFKYQEHTEGVDRQALSCYSGSEQGLWSQTDLNSSLGSTT